MDVKEPRTVVVTGANRGLGLEFTRQLLARGDRVVAGCRQPGHADALTQLAAAHPGHLHVAPLDVADERSRQAFAAEVEALHPSLDLLVNNAGVLPPGERFGALDPRVLEHTLQVNTIAPLMLAQALAPLLARGRRPRIFNLSSRLGSMALTQSFQTPSYNISKAALNMTTVLMARALNPMGIGVLAASPGWVRTDMGGDKAPVTAAESVRDMLEMLDRRAEPGAGEFVDRDGGPLPW
ncbi:MAG: short-chain dehydrogenase [Arenimonas sp. SCN 70-307]|nr:MAG: short-chain dehydrogenase [Arenimonas sp. SCN 70-307]